MAHVTSARDKTNGDGLPRVPSIPLTDDRAFDPNQQSIGNLVREATEHVSTLIRAEVELAKAELWQELRKALTGILFFLVAVALLLYTSPFVFFVLLEILDNFVTRGWAAFIVLVLVVVTIGVLVLLGIRKMKKIKAPERTINTLRGTADTLAHFAEDDETGTAVSPADPTRNQPRPR